jgi:hypothetical protein
MVVRRVLWRTACRALSPDFRPHWASRNARPMAPTDAIRLDSERPRKTDYRSALPTRTTETKGRNYQRPAVPRASQSRQRHRRHHVLRPQGVRSEDRTVQSNNRAVESRLRPIQMYHQFPRHRARHLEKSPAYRHRHDATRPHSHCCLRVNHRRQAQFVALSIRVLVRTDEQAVAHALSERQ